MKKKRETGIGQYFSIKYCLAGVERKISSSLDAFDNKKLDLSNVNQILELYNITKVFSENRFLDIIDDAVFEEYKELSNSIDDVIKNFFLNINEDNIISIYDSCFVIFLEDFWHFFYKYNVYSIISKDSFYETINNLRMSPNRLLVDKHFVDTFDSQISDVLKKPEYGAEFIVDYYMGRRDNGEKYYLPKSLTKVEKYNTVKEYIKTEFARAKVLDLIINGKSNNCKEFDPDVRLKYLAKEKYKDFWINRGTSIISSVVSINVSLSSDNRFHDVVLNGDKIIAKINTCWIKDHLDYPTLLNNFIYLFNFTDDKMRCALTAAYLKQESIEKVFSTEGNGIYQRGYNFGVYNSLANEVLRKYVGFLEKYNITIEKIITWFFESYLPNEFNIIGFHCSLPENTESILSRYERLASAMDGITKQFKLFCVDGEINRGLYEMISGSVRFKDIPSLITNKYAYVKNSNINREIDDLFSDCNMLSYTERTTEKYSTFYDLVMNDSLLYEEVMVYNKAEIDWLIERGVLDNKNGVLKFNCDRIDILKELYEKGFVCLQYTKNNTLKELINNQEIVVGSSLLAKPEWEYFDYNLNKSEFTNGLDLRNKYIHNNNSLDEEQQQNDYIVLLKLFIILVIKINEDICLKKELETKKDFYQLEV